MKIALWGLLAGLAGASALPLGPDNLVTVNLHVADAQGLSVENVWAIVLPNARPSVLPDLVKTDVTGRSQLACEKPASTTKLIVCLFPSGYRQGIEMVDVRPYVDQCMAAAEKQGWKNFYEIPLVSGLSEYDLSIGSYATTTARLKLVDEAGSDIVGGLATLMHSHGLTEKRRDGNPAGETGPLVLHGVPMGGETHVAVLFPASPKLKVFHITPSMSCAPVDLGDVVASPFVAESAHLTVTMLNAKNVSTAFWEKPMTHFVTMVSSDGEHVYLWEVDNIDKRTRLLNDDGKTYGPATVQPGKYYIAPGMPGTTLADKLYKAVVTGVILDDFGVPSITCVADEPVELEVDAVATEKAIRESLP